MTVRNKTAGSGGPKLPPIHAPKAASKTRAGQGKCSRAGPLGIKQAGSEGSNGGAGCRRKIVMVVPKGVPSHRQVEQVDAVHGHGGYSAVNVEGSLRDQGKVEADKALTGTASEEGLKSQPKTGSSPPTASSNSTKPPGRALPNDPEQSLKSLALRSFKAKRAKAEEAALNEASSKGEGSSIQAEVVRPKVGSGYGMYTDAWTKDSMLGRGSFGAVYKCTNLRTGETVAVKQVVIKSEEMLRRMIDEVVLMCRASFRNNKVVECFGWSVSHDSEASKEVHAVALSLGPDAAGSNEINSLGHADRVKAIGKNFNIVMECVDQGSISSLVKQNGPLNEMSLRRYLKQLLIGLRSLHAAGIAHRDIKCQNLLLTADHTLKVADFGCAKRASHNAQIEQAGLEGSVPWMAPEVVNPSSRQQAARTSKQTVLDMWKKADVWAIGCTIIEMARGKPPWNTYSNPASAMYAIATCKEPPQAPDSLNPQGKDFVRACLQLDPKKRPTVAVLCFHDYIKSAPS